MADDTPAPVAVAPVVHVMTDADMAAFAVKVAAEIKAGGISAQVKTDVKAGAEDVLAAIKQLVTDGSGAVTHVHGAAKAFQADVKSHWVLIGLFALTLMNTFFIVKDVFKAF